MSIIYRIVEGSGTREIEVSQLGYALIEKTYIGYATAHDIAILSMRNGEAGFVYLTKIVDYMTNNCTGGLGGRPKFAANNMRGAISNALKAKRKVYGSESFGDLLQVLTEQIRINRFDDDGQSEEGGC